MITQPKLSGKPGQAPDSHVVLQVFGVKGGTLVLRSHNS